MTNLYGQEPDASLKERYKATATYTIEINDVAAYGLVWDGITPTNSFTQ